MNPHSKGGHAAVGRACSAPGCHTVHFARGWCRPHYMRWYNQQRANGVAPLTPLAAPPPPFPRRTIVADYCRTCGCPVCSWGCAGGERVHWHDDCSGRLTGSPKEAPDDC